MAIIERDEASNSSDRGTVPHYEDANTSDRQGGQQEVEGKSEEDVDDTALRCADDD